MSIFYKKCLILKKLEIMNLENLNLVELNAQEAQETEGGNFDCGGYLSQLGKMLIEMVFSDGINGKPSR
jgi:hypothetical protein